VRPLQAEVALALARARAQARVLVLVQALVRVRALAEPALPCTVSAVVLDGVAPAVARQEPARCPTRITRNACEHWVEGRHLYVQALFHSLLPYLYRTINSGYIYPCVYELEQIRYKLLFQKIEDKTVVRVVVLSALISNDYPSFSVLISRSKHFRLCAQEIVPVATLPNEAKNVDLVALGTNCSHIATIGSYAYTLSGLLRSTFTP
jgi:hypothetical protein